MNALLVAQLWQILLGESEDLALVHASKLGVHLKVLFVKRLQSWVQQAG